MPPTLQHRKPLLQWYDFLTYGDGGEYCHICVPEQFSQPPPPPPGGPPSDRQPVPVPQPVVQPVATVNHASSGQGPTLAIQLADRILEPPTSVPSVVSVPSVPSPSVTSVVLGTAPPGTMGRPTPAAPPRVPPGTLLISKPRHAKSNIMNSQMQMGLLENTFCDNCGAQLCICFPGGYGFSQRLPLRGEANGVRNGAGDVLQGLQSVKDLMQGGEELRGRKWGLFFFFVWMI
eukprot:s774_g4.t1